jgi:hypothetical protein
MNLMLILLLLLLLLITWGLLADLWLQCSSLVGLPVQDAFQDRY